MGKKGCHRKEMRVWLKSDKNIAVYDLVSTLKKKKQLAETQTKSSNVTEANLRYGQVKQMLKNLSTQCTRDWN